MKAIKIFSLALSFAAIALTGCKDPCKDVACQNAGTCDDGTCICATGYEGTNCETEQRAKFLATYNVQESCTFFGNDNFTISIAPSAQGGVTGVVINNM